MTSPRSVDIHIESFVIEHAVDDLAGGSMANELAGPADLARAIERRVELMLAGAAPPITDQSGPVDRAAAEIVTAIGHATGSRR